MKTNNQQKSSISLTKGPNLAGNDKALAVNSVIMKVPTLDAGSPATRCSTPLVAEYSVS